LHIAGWLAVLIAAVSPASATAQSAEGLQFVDYTDDFERVWQETSTLPDAQKVPTFEAAFAKILPGFYVTERVKGFMTADRYHEKMLNALKEYPEKRAAIERVSHNFRSLIGPAEQSFEAQFGPMTGYSSIMLVHSLGEFDGGTRDLPGGMHLMFGADMIAQLHSDGEIQPFFHHELFHLLHARTFAPCDEVWCNLWQEGLAVYVASKLNPGASDAALLLTFPVPLGPAVEAHKQEAICAVRARLNSTDNGSMFTGGKEGLSPNLPPRFGYYVGYLVARDMGRTRDLKQLAGLPPAQVKPLLESSLGHMAECAAAALPNKHS